MEKYLHVLLLNIVNQNIWTQNADGKVNRENKENKWMTLFSLTRDIFNIHVEAWIRFASTLLHYKNIFSNNC